MQKDAGIEKIMFMGREITDADRVKVEAVFDEKINDFELFKAILAVSAKPENILARGAFTKALQKGYCGYSEGGREAKAMIRRVRRKMGYRPDALDGAVRASRRLQNLPVSGMLRAFSSAIDALLSLFRN